MKNGIVEFYGQELITARSDEGVEYVAMKPLCENLGLDWSAQRQRIVRDDVLKSCMVMITTQLKNDTQSRQILMIPTEFLNGWLFGVDTSRLKDEAVREKIIVYKKECFKVLHSYWSKGNSSVENRLDRLEIMVQTMSEGFKDLTSAFKDVASAISKQPQTTNVMMSSSPFVTINKSLGENTKKKDNFLKAVLVVLEDYPDGIAQTDLIYRSGFSQSEYTRRWLQENIGVLWEMFVIPGKGYRYILKEGIAEINS